MTRDELFASIVAAGLGRDDIVYLERTGDSYKWRLVGAESPRPQQVPTYECQFSAAWPLDESARLHAFLDDLLAELESMADSANRCRWPLDEPWPHRH